MQSHFHLLVRLAILSLGVLSFACGTDSPKASSTPFDFKIEKQGLSFIHLGDRLSLLDSLDIPYTLSEVEYQTEEGYIWMTREMLLDTGKIVFEGEFLDENHASPESFQQSTLSRIRIESPMLRFSDGPKTGISLGELKSYYPQTDWEYIYFPSYKMVDVANPDTPEIHFLVPEPPGVLPDTLEVGDLIDGSLLSEDLPVEAIVLL